MRRACVCGGGGFIGHHLVTDLKSRGYWVRTVDLKKPAFSASPADEFIVGDLRNPDVAQQAVKGANEIYQLAADMGGMGYISGMHDADIMHNSALINLNVLEATRQVAHPTLFYSSSACIYPRRNQVDPSNSTCREDSAYPADPDSDYGWEKLFSERMYQAYARDCSLQVKIARFHNVFGPEGTWDGGREKAPAALCRKVAQAPPGTAIEVWGAGDQTRSFLFIDECLEGIHRLMESDFDGPVNIGSEEMISINDLVRLIIDISGKELEIKNVPGPEGVRGRTSDNRLIREKLAWAPSRPLREGMEQTYHWINEQVERQTRVPAGASSNTPA
jgi:GDP-D-mannose 3', 5'-epimerase